MLSLNDFLFALRAAIPRFQQFPPNPNQERCIFHPSDEPLMIVAGPGSGKTTVLALRALRLVLVEGFFPESVIVTTFTRKAADEIRARLIEWGLQLVEYIRLNPPQPEPNGFSGWIGNLDVNRFVTGTLDSICEEVITRYRDPLAPVPVVVENFVGNASLAYDGLFPAGANRSRDVDRYLQSFTFKGDPPRNFGEKLAVSRNLVDRFIHDQVDLNSYRNDSSHTIARDCIANAGSAYWASLNTTNRMDFALLEQVFLERLTQGRMTRFSEGVRAVLVDEYQDTNPLQENIYFEIIRQTNGSFTVVGDDDQSLYRFRGATIELFRDFQSRLSVALPTAPNAQLEYLVDNYRSTPEIVQFFNDFIDTDPGFAPARVQPPKPRIIPQASSLGVPVLGMFRPSADVLADDLTDFLFEVFRGTGRAIQWNGSTTTILRDQANGDFGDAVYLAHTVNEYANAFGNNPPRQRLPQLIRQRFETRGENVFNPRGRALRDITEVQQLIGTILECIDPPAPGQPMGVQLERMIFNNHLRGEAVRYLSRWRQSARNFIASNPSPNNPHSLQSFVSSWQLRTPQGQMRWPDEWPILELNFKLLSWFPFLRDDPEGQVYLEAISRAISQAASFSSYRSSIVFNDPIHEQNSIRHAISDIFAPIAESNVEVDEDIMPSIPRNHFCFMTIHQAKGLEYPLVIVDVSSDYRTNHHSQRFRRFPENPSNVAIMEDDLAPHSQIGPLRQARSGMDRTFDDLVRLYYVAYSRPECILMLVGLDPILRYRTTIKHVATGWGRDDSWSWVQPVPGRRNPPLANNLPLLLI
jgi:DNA helicase-2/ATP-dependent DNA helicase PcrA